MEMIRQGVLAGPEVKAIFALHVSSELPTGKIGVREGATMAGVDRFRVVIRGKQVHAAFPWMGVDPVAASAHVIVALQTIVSRKLDPREPAVVSVAMVQGGQAWNILPGEVALEGTIRTLSADARRQVAEHFRRIIEQTAAAHGTTAQFSAFEDYAPPVWNDPRSQSA